jgi:hypothetical protein
VGEEKLSDIGSLGAVDPVIVAAFVHLIELCVHVLPKCPQNVLLEFVEGEFPLASLRNRLLHELLLYR